VHFPIDEEESHRRASGCREETVSGVGAVIRKPEQHFGMRWRFCRRYGEALMAPTGRREFKKR